MHVHVRGDGLASWCGATLLSRSGLRVTVDRTTRRGSRLILIGDPTQALLVDLAGNPSPFLNAPRIRKRVVAWGPDAAPREFEHSSAIVNESALLEDLWARAAFETGHAVADWNILANAPVPAEEHRFGTRMANVAHVDLVDQRETCWIESFEHGWLFLIAGGDPQGYLISVGAPAETLLESSRCIRDQVAALHPIDGQAAAYPRISAPMHGPGWLACGTAATALDPLCGDGAGHAIREAILAAAVLRAVARGADPAGLLGHYESRLQVAFERHLKICEGFYSTGGSGNWWKSELELLREGQEFCSARAPRQWHYRLNGFDLTPL